MLLRMIKFVYDISTDYVMSHAKQILAFSLIMLAFVFTISLVPINVYFGYALILIILTFSISAEIAKRFNKNWRKFLAQQKAVLFFIFLYLKIAYY